MFKVCEDLGYQGKVGTVGVTHQEEECKMFCWTWSKRLKRALTRSSKALESVNYW